MEKRSVDVVVLSDMHLGTYGCKAKELLAYLKSIQPGILILNGDIIDIWQLSKSYFPTSHMAVIKEILHFMMNGTRVFYITGNHDESLRRYTDVHLSNFTMTDKLVLEIDHKMTWIFHGDVFDNTTRGSAKLIAKLGSSGYGALILFNRLINRLLKFFGKERISISRRIMQSVNKAIVKINNFEEVAAEIAIEKKYDYVICGHIHQPQIKEIVNEKGKVTYLNSGDWIEHMTSLEYHQHQWKLFTYDESIFEEIKIEKKKETNVVTDGIDYHITHLVLQS